MRRKKTSTSDCQNPNFILYDMGLQSAFTHMCHQFQKQNMSDKNDSQDWVIIDNDTGEIVTPVFDTDTKN